MNIMTTMRQDMNTIERWERKSATYTAFHQGDMPERIIGHLVDIGVLGEGRDVLEIGSGPGTYSGLLAQHCDNLFCLDSSKGMLERLRQAVPYENVTPILGDWSVFEPGRTFDLCIATLCPGAGSPESLQRMESISDEYQALVFWRHNHGDDHVSEARRILGLPDPLLQRGKGLTQSWLEENGRDFTVKTFSAEVHYELPLQPLIERTVTDLEYDGDPMPAIMEALGPHIVDDMFVLDCTNLLDLVLWS